MENSTHSELNEFNCIYKEMGDLYHKISMKLGLSDSEFLILYALVELNINRQKDIADYFFMSKQTVNSAVKKLIKSEIIELRQSKDRDMQIIFTEMGENFAKEKLVPIINIEKDTFVTMGKTESQELLRLTRKHMEIFKELINKHYLK
jgi:DNA-binding MarR family transcriptional regulator